MSHGTLLDLERKLEHSFADRGLLERALTHRSLAFEQCAERRERKGPAEAGSAFDVPAEPPAPAADNERLEFLGDAVLSLLSAEALWSRYPALKEGDLTRLRAALVSRKHLAQVALSLRLGDYVRLGRGEERSGGRKKLVLLANTVEAVLAALYLDGGLEAARNFALRSIVNPYAETLCRELQAGHAMGDHKSALQEMLQAHKELPPEYQVKAESGPDHQKRFLVEVRVGGGALPLITARGSGSTKKKAEQEAARKAVAKLHALTEVPSATAPSLAGSPTRQDSSDGGNG